MADRDVNGGGVSIDPRTAALGAEAGSLPLPVGTVLERGFVIRSVLGRGGFGVTYMAEHTGLGRRVALKEHFPEQFAIRQGLSVRATSSGAAMFKWGLDRFLEEAKRLARFKHPSVVDVSDVFEANGTAYMALAYEEGETLGSWLDRLGRPPTQSELDRLLVPILDALEHVHGHGILHRDIAPDNIMLRHDGTPVLIDFGAARQAMAERSHTLTGIVKHGYSPPEQYATKAAHHGPWSDIYSLSATLYRAMTGASVPAATDRQIQDDVRDLSPLAARGYRSSFLTAITAALALKPAERPQSVAAWRSALLPGSRSSPASRPATVARPSNVVPGPGASSRVTSGPRPAASSQSRVQPIPSGLLEPPPPSRTPWALIGGLVVMLTLLAGGGWYAWTSVRTEETRLLAEVRREIAAATTSEALDGIARRAPKSAPEIARRREELAAITRYERLKLLREQIARETSTANLDRIAAEAPELRPDIERRKAELAAEAKAARLRLVRERIAASTSMTELDQIAAEEAEVRVDVEARKLALVRAARVARVQALRERIPATTDEAELDRIAAEAPELASAARTRKAELARLKIEQEAEVRRRAEQVRLARVQALRERIPVTSDPTELDRIANEAPELAGAVQARKSEIEGRNIEAGALAAIEPVCRPFQEALAWDADGDFQRNAAVLDNEQISICRVAFQEAGVPWSLQIIRKRSAKGTYVPGPLWVVPHDNENAAFGSALYGLKGYGGTVVAVETGGQRLNAGVDPNRNFSDGRPCADSARTSALYTREVLRWRTEGMPVIALHTNDPGWAGDGSGQGHISMKNRTLGNTLPGVPSILRFRNDDTMVFVASRLPLSANQTILAHDINFLRSNGIHVIYEHVTAQKNDCSLSNYAALRGIQGYFNIEVAHGDGATQRAILDILLPRLLAPNREKSLDTPHLVKIIEESQAPATPQTRAVNPDQQPRRRPPASD